MYAAFVVEENHCFNLVDWFLGMPQFLLCPGLDDLVGIGPIHFRIGMPIIEQHRDKKGRKEYHRRVLGLEVFFHSIREVCLLYPSDSAD